jgi:gamma-glutamyltranspeptidase/glutathione hydrolase
MLVNKDFVMPFGVMGGFMQPQGHVQVLWNIIINGMNSQQALDLPRVYLHPIMNDEEQKWKLSLEEGIAEDLSDELKQVCNLDKVDIVSGHERALFGRGQIIIAKKNGVFCAGSDPRSDGLAIGF